MLETSQVTTTIPKQLASGATSYDLTWALNCVVWASVDQQDKKKQFSKADSDALRELCLQVSVSVCSTPMKHIDLLHIHCGLAGHILNWQRTNRVCIHSAWDLLHAPPEIKWSWMLCT